MASTGAIVRDGNNTAGSTAALRALGVFYVGLTPGIIGSIWINMETLVGCSFPRSSDQFNKGTCLGALPVQSTNVFEYFLNDQQVRTPHETQPLLVQLSNGCIDTKD